MKVAVIKASQIHEYLKYVRVEEDIRLELERILDLQATIKTRLKRIKRLAETLRALKQKYRFKSDKDIEKAIKKVCKKA